MTWEYVFGMFAVTAALLAIAAWADERRERRLAAEALARQRKIASYLAGHREASRREIIGR